MGQPGANADGEAGGVVGLPEQVSLDSSTVSSYSS